MPGATRVPSVVPAVPAVGREGASVVARLVGRLMGRPASSAGPCGVLGAGWAVAGVAAARLLAPAMARASPAGGSMGRGGGEADGGSGA